MLRKQKAAGKWFGGICAAPVDVLHFHALLDGAATCYPSLQHELGTIYRDEAVVVSGKCITSQGPHTALAMGLKLVEILRGEKTAHDLAEAILVEYAVAPTDKSSSPTTTTTTTTTKVAVY